MINIRMSLSLFTKTATTKVKTSRTICTNLLLSLNMIHLKYFAAWTSTWN